LTVVCEDNPVSRRVMEAMISKLGCRVISHADGAEAVRCAMGDVKFDIILTDIKLPKSTSPLDPKVLHFSSRGQCSEDDPRNREYQQQHTHCRRNILLPRECRSQSLRRGYRKTCLTSKIIK